MVDAVLDSSAVLALLNGEPGGEAVREILPTAVVSAVNLAEILTKLTDGGTMRALHVVRVDLHLRPRIGGGLGAQLAGFPYNAKGYLSVQADVNLLNRCSLGIL